MSTIATATEMSHNIEIVNTTGEEYLKTIPHNSVDLILTDPPYIISRETGMNKHYNAVAENKSKGVEFVKTEEEWEAYKAKHKVKEDAKGKKKENYLKYGTMLGKKYCKKNRFWRLG